MSEYDSLGGFTPYTSPMRVPGSSYAAQIGKENELWVIRLVKGKEILERGTFEELNGNKMIAFIIQNVAIPMINPYQISQTVKALIKQAERGPLQAMPATSTAAPGAAASPAASARPAPAALSAGGVSGDACTRCARPIQANFYFCPYCSQPLRQYNCPGCKREIRLDYVMCPYCGIKI